MTTSEVENYPGFPNGIFGPELMMNMRQQAERFGAKLLDDEVVEVDFIKRPFGIKTHSQEFRSESVVICTGASPRKLGLELSKSSRVKGSHTVQHVMDPFSKERILQS